MAKSEKRKSPRDNGKSDITHLKKRIRKTANEIQGRREKIEDTLKDIEKQEKALRKIANRKKSS